MTYKALKEAVLAVQENEKCNGYDWRTWNSADHIVETYEIETLTTEEEQVLERAIASNGATVDADMSAQQTAEFGSEFNTWK